MRNAPAFSNVLLICENQSGSNKGVPGNGFAVRRWPIQPGSAFILETGKCIYQRHHYQQPYQITKPLVLFKLNVITQNRDLSVRIRRIGEITHSF